MDVPMIGAVITNDVVELPEEGGKSNLPEDQVYNHIDTYIIQLQKCTPYEPI